MKRMLYAIIIGLCLTSYKVHSSVLTDVISTVWHKDSNYYHALGGLLVGTTAACLWNCLDAYKISTNNYNTKNLGSFYEERYGFLQSHKLESNKIIKSCAKVVKSSLLKLRPELIVGGLGGAIVGVFGTACYNKFIG